MKVKTFFKHSLLFSLFFIQVTPNKHFHAYKFSSAGANVMVDPGTARYQDCNIDVLLKPDLIKFGQQQYHIYRTQKTDTAFSTFFCYHLRGQDSVFCSITVMPAEESKQWYLLIAFEDSTKAYKAIALK